MIYFLLGITLLIYFFFLVKNIGENKNVNLSNKYIVSTILILSFLLTIYYLDHSFIQDRHELQKISQKHEKLRSDIIKIKSNIPLLVEKLDNDPDYYIGWVMLARSYQLIGDKLNASMSFANALKIRNNETDIIQEYIFLLKSIDNKKNKDKIIQLFHMIIDQNSDDINIYNMLLNYSIEINDIQLTRRTLETIVNKTNIVNKKRYVDALKRISSTSVFNFDVKLSKSFIKRYKNMKYIFIILKESNMPPVAVKRISGNALVSNITITSDNIMLASKDVYDKEINLIIKSGNTPLVNDQLKEIFKSEVFRIKDKKKYFVEN